MFKKGHALLAKAACAFFAVFAAVAAKAAVNDLNSMVAADMGYVLTGLGDNGSGVALVFTNHTKSAKWTVPAKLENVQFLVVAGGGGGGGVATNGSVEQGGAGGGGGGVVTGYIKELSAGATVNVVVGAGGAGGVANTDPNPLSDEDAAGASHPGGNSIFYVTNVEYIVAYGGGRDLGVGNLGGVGGSCAGNRMQGDTDTLPEPIKGAIGGDATNYLSDVEIYGSKGGTANYDNAKASGGGGGAVSYTDNDYNAGGSWADSDTIHVGGRGGRGLLSSITGTSLYYGSGASGGSSTDTHSDCLERTGEGAGAGGYGEFAATDAVANQGGGGGGGGGDASISEYNGNGGNGGSGIVVFRFTLPVKPVVAQVQDLAYTGSELRGVYEGFGYTLSGTVTATEIGTYTTTATLDYDYNMWADGTTDRTLTIEWRIWPASFVAANHGYTVRGLGETGEEVAVVFTNHNAGVMTWTAPRELRTVRFLVVGGGGGAGGEATVGDGYSAGAGGGGGGVVTGVIYKVAAGAVLSVDVGRGGDGGKAGNGSDTTTNGRGSASGTAGRVAEDSYFQVDGTTYVTAKAGGRDQGSSKRHWSNVGNKGSKGGSGAGCRPIQDAATAVTDSDGGVIGDSVGGLIKYVRFAKAGGPAPSVYASGGGGGAMAVGTAPVDGTRPGNGGTGLYCDITGESRCYGSGGGGGTCTTPADDIHLYGLGGPGAGNGNRVRNGNGYSAVANQGGGGGGGGGGWKVNEDTDDEKEYGANGGNGGSGIVVFRFRLRPPMFRVIVR